MVQPLDLSGRKYVAASRSGELSVIPCSQAPVGIRLEVKCSDGGGFGVPRLEYCIVLAQIGWL